MGFIPTPGLEKASLLKQDTLKQTPMGEKKNTNVIVLEGKDEK